ncbi:MAG: hypothetical protein QNK24_05350 [Desulfuromusa sp.]|nr:hypothetical protein [Desulfuromusa sp.]
MGISGTGLGLAIVWNTLQAQDGGITAESSPHRTIFELFFPATTEEKNDSTDTVMESSPPHSKGERIIGLYPQQKALFASGYADNQDVRKTLVLGAS